jgi:hypothetical protein
MSTYNSDFGQVKKFFFYEFTNFNFNTRKTIFAIVDVLLCVVAVRHRHDGLLVLHILTHHLLTCASHVAATCTQLLTSCVHCWFCFLMCVEHALSRCQVNLPVPAGVACMPVTHRCREPTPAAAAAAVPPAQVQEAMLTGESVPISKNTSAVPADVGLGDRKCLAYSATAVSAGQGLGVVIGTGAVLLLLLLLVAMMPFVH